MRYTARGTTGDDGASVTDTAAGTARSCGDAPRGRQRRAEDGVAMANRRRPDPATVCASTVASCCMAALVTASVRTTDRVASITTPQRKVLREARKTAASKTATAVARTNTGRIMVGSEEDQKFSQHVVYVFDVEYCLK